MPMGLRRRVLDDPRPEDTGHRPEQTLARRAFLVGTATAAFATACTRTRQNTPASCARGPAQVELWSFFDLPADDPRSRELSGVAWDTERRVLWAVQDETPYIVALIPDRDFRSWRFGETITVDAGGPVDLEGLVVFRDGFFVCSEQGPRIFEVDRTGTFRSDLAVPPRFREARSNKSLESLTMSPSGRYLFTTTEAALERDGERATAQTGTRVRILRMDRTSAQLAEHTYETDSAPYEGGDWGIADLAAISDTELFVLERGWSKGRGNTARIYQTALDERASCLGLDQLSATGPVLAKTLRVDLSKLQATGLPEPKQPQPAPLLDNYEGIALGPRLPNGRQSLLVVSDDNGHANQFARVLVLAV
ncbi:MAG TPA: esterase-like activity of phytase family protein [Labilithrix sp.]|nr:esterase-like activity of phytase family protein [Labilithrix sp.]